MEKKVIVVKSSFRHLSNSSLLADAFIKGASEVGNDVFEINLKDIDLKFCTGCLSCTKTNRCIHKDSMNELYYKISNANVLVLATPIYYYAVSGQMKTFIDRLNHLFTKDNKFTDVYLLASSAEDDKYALEGAIKEISGFVECFEDVSIKGIIYGTGVTEPNEIIKKEAYQEAYQLGKNI